MFGVPFLQAGSSWFLFIVESAPCGWVWTSNLSRFSWLGEFVSVFWWVELDLFFIECNEVSSSEFCSVCGFGMPFSSVQFNRSVVSDSLRPHELQHTRPPCLSPTPMPSDCLYFNAQSCVSALLEN